MLPRRENSRVCHFTVIIKTFLGTVVFSHTIKLEEQLSLGANFTKYEEQVRRLGNLHYKTYATSLWTSGEYVFVQSLSQCNLNGCCTALCVSGSAWSVV